MAALMLGYSSIALWPGVGILSASLLCHLRGLVLVFCYISRPSQDLGREPGG